MGDELSGASGDLEERLERLEKELEAWKSGNSNMGKEAAEKIARELLAARPLAKTRYVSLLGFEIEDDE